MMNVVLYSHLKKELFAVKKIGVDIVCRLSDDDWNIFDYFEKRRLDEFLNNNPIINLSCIDVTAEGGIESAENARRTNKSMYMILISDNSVSPVSYIRPTIVASALMLRPLNTETVKKVFVDAVKQCLKDYNSKCANEENYVIDNREGRQLIPYDKIKYFESRSKKIFVVTENCEYSVYDTLDNLEKVLPKGFVRCHRSYIIAVSEIKKIAFSQNIIELEEGDYVPLSRSYKGVLKDLK